MRIQVCFLLLILGLHFGSHLSVAPEQLIARTPQSIANTMPSPAGRYYLVNGTEGCPAQMDWSPQCDGFILNSIDNANITEAQKFCNINKGPKTTREKMDNGYKTLLVEVTRQENVIRRQDTTILVNKKDSASLYQEDTVIFDETGKFLWEHSQNRKGTSCLYSR